MKKGSADVTLYVGSSPVGKAYKGSVEVYSSAPSSYDSAVEFLASSGEQYINTGLIPQGDEIIEITFRCTTNQNACFCGCRTSQTAGKCLIGSGSNYTIIYAGLGASGNVRISAFNQNKHTIILDVANGTASIDGGTAVTIGSFASNNLSIFLFACNQAGSAALFSTIEIYSVKIGNRASYIPVRVGTTGYMYDEVSGNLLGNSGTGGFVVGPDCVEPTE